MIAAPRTKNGVCLIFKSQQGTGKTELFTNIICKILDLYAIPNMDRIDDILGNFNHLRENKKLIVLNEIGNNEADQNHIKSVITDETFIKQGKGTNQVECENVNNIIITTNNDNPVVIQENDRRFCVIQCSNKYAAPRAKAKDAATEKQREINYQYFEPIFNERDDPEFYDTLYTYLMKEVDIKGFKARDFPITAAREDITDYNRSYYERFIIEHIPELTEGILSKDATTKFMTWIAKLTNEASKYTERKLSLELSKYCIKTNDGSKRGYKGFNANGQQYFADEIEAYTKQANEIVGDTAYLDNVV
jgi:hypothetical protein